MKNPFGKSINIQDFISGKTEPYALYKGNFGGWGETTVAILKTYKLAKNEQKDQYARWFTAAKSDMTGGRWEFGDQFAWEIRNNFRLIECTDEWRDTYDPMFKAKERMRQDIADIFGEEIFTSGRMEII